MHRSRMVSIASRENFARKVLTQAAVGLKPNCVGEETCAIPWLPRLVVLLCRENEAPAGILPLAFSDIPRSCSGTASSIEEDTDGVRDITADESDGVGFAVPSSSSESSSSPIENALFSSGMLLIVPVRCGGRICSVDAVRVGLPWSVTFAASSFR